MAGVFDAERAAEAAAGFGVLHLLEREARNPRQKRARLRFDAELTQAGTRIVIGCGARKRGRDAVEAGDVLQEAHQLVGARGQILRFLTIGGAWREQFAIVAADHAAAGTRRRDDIREAFESLDGRARDRPRAFLVAAVVVWLPAARLARNDHLVARRRQQLRGREADARPQGVDKTRDKQGYAPARRHEIEAPGERPRPCPRTPAVSREQNSRAYFIAFR